MDSVTLRDFRCFRGEQTARMAPLTLLVGENSTGKTSFLALLRALRRVAFADAVPDFRQPPYDLGSFSEVVYNDSRKSGQPKSFRASFSQSDPKFIEPAVSFSVEFKEQDGFPYPVSRKFSQGDTWFAVGDRSAVRLGIGERFWETGRRLGDTGLGDSVVGPMDAAVRGALQDWSEYMAEEAAGKDDSNHDASFPDVDDFSRFEELHRILRDWKDNSRYPTDQNSEVFAGAPIRSQPRRTYDPIQQSRDPEGEYIPSYLASMSRRDRGGWESLREGLEYFGGMSGLFDEISINSLGRTAGAPFQVHIRKFGEQLKGPRRNLVDVGYGVSQVLPLLTELMRWDTPPMFLLQQPEVHLHPRAQAELGSLLCFIAETRRQLVVETHSDYIIDRVRMDVRDGKTDLNPEDVSILYFERGDLDVKIHSIRLDADGNVLDAPEGYRQFFADELTRSIGL